eukprot:87326-Chlamydomonas_euryale.AAC.1
METLEGHPVSRLGLSVAARQCNPRDSQFKHAETLEGHPASRLGLSVACSPNGPLGAETLEGHPASQCRMQSQWPARCGDP